MTRPNVFAPFFRALPIKLCSLFAITLSACASIDTTGATIEQVRAVKYSETSKWPIVYSPDYNISFAGLERLHPFDTQKYGRVFETLKSEGVLTEQTVYTPLRPDQSVLTRHHSEGYLQALEKSEAVARFTQIPLVYLLPGRVAYNAVVEPAKLATSGSILAGELALSNGWAINLSGGYHHASQNTYGGFCAIADISLSILHLRDNHANIKNVMIIDLDAHQGNGHERDFIGDEATFIVDAYNTEIYPGDSYAKRGIDLGIELQSQTPDEIYLSKLKSGLNNAFTQFSPDVIYYVAGTDILDGDRLGRLSVSAEGVIARDELIFNYAQSRNIPVIMLLAGGYQKNNARIIARSISSLIETFELEPAVSQ